MVLGKLKYILKEWLVPPALLKASRSLLTHEKERALTTKEHLLLEENRSMKDRHKGERCFILGAGSSIAKQDLKKLQGENVISVSNTFVHPDYSIFKPKYHVLPQIIQGHGRLYSQEKFITWLKDMEQKTLEAEMFFHIGDKRMIDDNDLFKGRTIHWNEYIGWDGKSDFPIDLSRVPSVWSVSEFAITVALHLGFDKIYLLGFDHDWFNGPLVYFYDHKTQHALKPTSDKLSFADAEFQMRRHADIFKKYKYFYEQKNNIYNANADSKHYMDVFPKIDYDTLFEGQ